MKADEKWIADILSDLRERSLYRSLRAVPGSGGSFSLNGVEYLNFSSNAYLGSLGGGVTAGVSDSADSHGSFAACSSRLVSGTFACHEALEAELASWLRYPSALVFGAGYLANLSLVSVLAGRGDVVFADRLVHASLVDGMVLSRAGIRRFSHNDTAHLEDLFKRESKKRRKTSRFLLLTESVFSMDGDLAPLAELAALAKRYEAMLMVDEAHALGVFGPHGAGSARQEGVEMELTALSGTLSKAFLSYGGFAACSMELRELLVNRARPFIYNTALPPVCVEQARRTLRALQQNSGIGGELLRRASVFRSVLQSAGLNTLKSRSQIVPLLVGENERVLKLSQRLWMQGILAVAIREPTVPRGTARLRFSVTMDHREADLTRAADCIIAEARQVGLL